MQPQTQSDQDALPPANLVRRIVALAVDLCVVMAAGAMVLLAISLAMPLDSPMAQTPRNLVFFLAAVYLVWGRDHGLPSPGRRVLRMRLVQLKGPLPGFLSKSIALNADPEPSQQNKQISNAVIVSLLCSMIAAGAMLLSLETTLVFQAARQYAQSEPDFADRYGEGAVLSRLAQSLLIGKRSAFMRVGIDWEQDAVSSIDSSQRLPAVEFFLTRASPTAPWRVNATRASADGWNGQYGLFVADPEIPRPPVP